LEGVRGGAKGADGGGVWGGGIPLPSGVGSGEGAVPPSQKNFGIFLFEMVHFWRTFRSTVIVTVML